MTETIYETTIANYESVIGALPANTADTPYTVRITDIENLIYTDHYPTITVNSNLGESIINASKFVNILFKEGDIWNNNDAVRMFYNCVTLVSIDLSPFNIVESATNMFAKCTSLKKVENIMNTYDVDGFFAGCSALTDISFKTGWSSSCIGSFEGCSSLTSIDTSKFKYAKNISYMFKNCTSLNLIDISNFPNINNSTNIFTGCSALTDIIISNMNKELNQNLVNSLPISITDIFFTKDKKTFPFDYEVYLEPYSTLQNKTLHYVLSDVYPKETTLANYARNVSSLDVNNYSTPYDIKITDFKDHVATDFSAAIIGGDRYVNLTFTDDIYESDDGTSMFEDCVKIVSLDLTPFEGIKYADNFLKNVPISDVDESKFTELIDAVDMFDGTGKQYFDFTNSPNLETLSVPASAKTLKANGTALSAIDLSSAADLEYLDLSNTNITSLNLINCSSLPYCEWDTINDEKVLVKGWLAKNCTHLLTVTATETQVQDANLGLKNDTNALEGCTALTEVEVACSARPSYSGNEIHYGTVKFENEVIFNNGLSLGEQALKDIFNICHPIGEKYIQLGGEKFPWEMYPLTKKVDWENISNQYANEFFRVAGGDKPMGYFLTEDTEIVVGKTYYTRSGTDPNYTYTAVASPTQAGLSTYYELSENLTASTINNGDSDYLHEIQPEGLPNIYGVFNAQSGLSGNCSGAFYRGGSTKNDSGSGGGHDGYVFSAASGERKLNGTFKNDVYGKSDHVTVQNSAVQIWRRIN